MAVVDELIAMLGYDIRGEQNLTRWQRSIDAAEKRLVAFSAAARRFATIAGVAVGAGVGALGRGIINTNAQFESFEATLTTIEGSSQKAKQSLSWITEFAKTTPYEVAEVTEAFVRMKSYGIDPTDGSLKAVGDAGSAMGKSLMQGVEAFADAATFQFERLREFGVTAKQEGDKVTFSWTENGKTMTKEVAKRGDEVTKFLSENFRRFDGAMDLQSRTYRGIVSNLSDTWSQFLRQIGDAGFFDFVKNQLQGLKDKLDQWANDGTLQKWATRISDAFIAVSQAILVVVDRLVTHGEAIAKWLSGLDTTSLYAIGAAFAALLFWLWPVGSAFAVIIAALDDILTWWEGGESFFGDFVKAIQDLTGAGDGLAAVLAGIVATLGVLIAMRPLAALKGIGNFIRGFAEGAGGALAEGIGSGGKGGKGGIFAFLGKAGIIGTAALALANVLGDAQQAVAGSSATRNANSDAAMLMSRNEEQRRKYFGDDEYYDIVTRERGYDRSGPSSRGGRRGNRGVAPDRDQGDDWTLSSGDQSGALQGLIASFNANLAKMTAGAAAGATITDARQDNRSFPVNVGVGGVVVNVAAAAAAPGATGAAVGSAVGQAAAGAAGRLQTAPAF